MKRILMLLLIVGPCLFLFVKDVKAEEIYNRPVTYNEMFGTYIDNYVQFKDLNTGAIYGSDSILTGFSDSYGSDSITYEWRAHRLPSDNYSSSSSGVAISSCSNSFVKDNYYSITAYYFVTPKFYVHNTYAINNNFIGLGYNYADSFNSRTIYPVDFYTSIAATHIVNGYYIQFNSITFKANKNASCISFPVNKSGGGLTHYNFDYVGMKVSYQGVDPPTVDGVTSYIEQESKKINENIDSMKEKQDKTNELIESEDDDTTSKKCGMLCKLKGIFTGIIELPSKLVNLLVNALKSLFVPTDDQLYEIVNESKELTENFGFVGESVNFFLTIFTSLLGLVNANGCIELPEFSIGATSLFESHTFWQAQNVCLGDNAILSANITTIRTITSIVLVSLFINFASRKFFSILSKNDNDQARNDAYDIK